MTHTFDDHVDDDIVVLGDMTAPTSPPTLRLVDNDTTPTIARVQPLPPLPTRRYSPVQWLSFAATMTALAVLSLTIVLFEPPTYLAVAAIAAAAVCGSLLVAAEAITAVVTRQPVDTLTRHRVDDDAGQLSISDVVSGGFDVHTLDLGD